VLQLFPGVFSGIGEFTIHKEFVSSKVAGDVASADDPALDRILDFAGEAGLIAIVHNDIHMPFPKEATRRVYFDQMKKLLDEILADPTFTHVSFDISWTEVAKYVVAPPDQQSYLHIDDLYAPLWAALSPAARQKVRMGNYERLFDEARTKVRAWEQANVEG
jgi:hypothetical protein